MTTIATETMPSCPSLYVLRWNETNAWLTSAVNPGILTDVMPGGITNLEIAINNPEVNDLSPINFQMDYECGKYEKILVHKRKEF